MVQLGRLEKETNLRDIWSDEAGDFTPWLAQEENLNLLGKELGIDMELIATEVKTGSFFTDILARDCYTEDKIVIENQLENTNHEHLGKIITYASGHDAKTIIWVVKKVREEHRRAIDWLNDHTDDEINIFLCEIELWRIDNSVLAPKFQIISSPNNWSKTIKRSTNNDLSDTKMLQLNYWTKVAEKIDSEYPILNSTKPPANNWYALAIGSSNAHIVLAMNTMKKEISSKILIKRNNKDLFDYLYSQKDEIEEEFGSQLVWRKVEDQEESNIYITNDMDLINEDDWEEAIHWHSDMAERFYNVFSKRISEFR